MSGADNELQKLFAQNDLAQWVEKADAAQVHALVKRFGVEECASIVHQLPPEKLLAVIDLDVWKRSADSRLENFDAAQFLCWLKTLLYAGTEHAVDAIEALGVEFSAGMLAHYIDQTPMEIFAMTRAESGLALEDKDVEHGDPRELGIYCGSYVRLVESHTLDELEDVFLELLGGFEEHAPEFLYGVFQYMTRRESDANLRDDLVWDRLGRLESRGYTPAHKARELLLRYRTETGLKARHAPSLQVPWTTAATSELAAELSAHLGLDSMHTTPRAPSHAGALEIRQSAREFNLVRTCFAWLQTRPARERERAQQELAWLANLFAGGWSLGGKPMKPQVAVQTTSATLELGLHLWLQRTPEAGPTCLVDAFEGGWQYLLAQVALPAAHALDRRLKLRAPGNGELREAWFRACTRRKLKEFGMARWIRQGRYALAREVLEEIEFALPAEAAFLARLMLDDTPRVPHPDTHGAPEGRIAQRGLLVSTIDQQAPFLARIRAALDEKASHDR